MFIVRNDYIRANIWDNFIENSINSVEFLKKWYLDVVVPKWIAIILNDFLMAMPIPYKSFIAAKLIDTPPFLPYMGIISRIGFQQEDFTNFISKLPGNYMFIDYRFNKFNNLPFLTKLFFYSVNLSYSYQYLYNNYSDKIKKYLSNNEYKIYVGIIPSLIRNFLIRNNLLTSRQLQIIMRLISESLLKEKGIIYGAYDKGDRLVGFAFFLLSKYSTDLIYIATEGNREDIAVYIIDKFLKKNEMSSITLNFTCSFCRKFLHIFRNMATDKYYVYSYYSRYLKKVWEYKRKNSSDGFIL